MDSEERLRVLIWRSACKAHHLGELEMAACFFGWFVRLFEVQGVFLHADGEAWRNQWKRLLATSDRNRILIVV